MKHLNVFVIVAETDRDWESVNAEGLATIKPLQEYLAGKDMALVVFAPINDEMKIALLTHLRLASIKQKQERHESN